MNNPELFNKTLGIIEDAYNKGRLEHGSCCACLVGNLIARNCGYEVIKASDRFIWWREGIRIGTAWGAVFSTDSLGQSFDIESYAGVAKDQIDSTGYTLEELARIEKAFEFLPKEDDQQTHLHNGLLAAMQVVDEIHETGGIGVERIKALIND